LKISLVPALGDLDNDQRPDLLFGTRNGGLLLLKNNSALVLPNAAETNDLVVYPNPAQNFAYVRVPALGTLELVSVTGQRLQQVVVSQTQTESVIDTEDLAAGLYFVRFVNGSSGTQTTRKLVISR
jgi:Secretion system C-terminal sorting domain